MCNQPGRSLTLAILMLWATPAFAQSPAIQAPAIQAPAAVLPLPATPQGLGILPPVHYQQTVEPLLRASATLEVVTMVPVSQVADIVLDHVL